MLNLNPVSISDKKWVDKLVCCNPSRSAEYDFGSMIMWGAYYPKLIGRCGDRLIMLTEIKGRKLFSFPIGSGELSPAVDAIIKYAKDNDFPFRMVGIENENRALLEELYPERFEFTYNRGMCDYLYKTEKLCTLSGKALHGKRNHINRFEQEHDWRFETLKKEHFPLCMELFNKWLQRFDADKSFEDERLALETALEHYDELELLGGALYAEDRFIAFTIGERNCRDCFDTHFEKADPDINGAYPMINREFARLIAGLYPEIEYINREEDLDIENLRKAKLSYHPDILIDKYSAVLRTEEI